MENMDMSLKKLCLSLFVALFLSVGPAFAADKININTATQEELQALNGIGASTAAAIVAHREQAGPYTSVDDLVEVKGIGDKKLAKLADQLTVKDSE